MLDQVGGVVNGQDGDTAHDLCPVDEGQPFLGFEG